MSEATGPLAHYLRQAAQELAWAERQLDHDVRPQREAVHRELVAAAAAIGRALHLIGAGS